MNNDFPVEELLAQLEQAKIADKDMKNFGSKEHQYSLNPPASIEQV